MTLREILAAEGLVSKTSSQGSPAEQVYHLLDAKLRAEWGNVQHTSRDHNGQNSPAIPLGNFMGMDFALRVQVNPAGIGDLRGSDIAVVSATLLHKPYQGKWEHTFYDREVTVKGFGWEWWDEFTSAEVLEVGSPEDFVRQEWAGIKRFVSKAKKGALSALKGASRAKAVGR